MRRGVRLGDGDPVVTTTGPAALGAGLEGVVGPTLASARFGFPRCEQAEGTPGFAAMPGTTPSRNRLSAGALAVPSRGRQRGESEDVSDVNNTRNQTSSSAARSSLGGWSSGSAGGHAQVSHPDQ